MITAQDRNLNGSQSVSGQNCSELFERGNIFKEFLSPASLYCSPAFNINYILIKKLGRSDTFQEKLGQTFEKCSFLFFSTVLQQVFDDDILIKPIFIKIHVISQHCQEVKFVFLMESPQTDPILLIELTVLQVLDRVGVVGRIELKMRRLLQNVTP